MTAVPAIVQTAHGNNNIQIALGNVSTGAKVDLNINARPQKPIPRRLPVEVRPRTFPNLLDRQPELHTASQALTSRQPVEISGEAGLGKTVLLRALGHSSIANTQQFPAGVVFRPEAPQSVDDLLQQLYSFFFDYSDDYKPTASELTIGLQNLQALVLLDDVDLTRTQVDALLNQAPKCTFVLATTESALGGEGETLTLKGLPEADALALIERRLGRSLTSRERTVARKLCIALKGIPDRLEKAAASVRVGHTTFDAILSSLPTTPLTSTILTGLNNPAQKVLSVLALGRGRSIPLEHIASLAGLPDARAALQTLQQRNLVQAHSPRYSLTGTLAQELWREWNLVPWAEGAVDYFTQWAEAQQGNSGRIIDSVEVILLLLEWAVAAKRWVEVLKLGRAIEVALALGMRWGAWLQVLNWILTAAQALSDQAVEGWAFHQIGTRALGIGDPQAEKFLRQALQIRQVIGDKAGLAVTQHNLNLLLGPLIPPQQGKSPPPKGPSPVKAFLPKVLWSAIGVSIVAATVIGGILLYNWFVNPVVPTPTSVVTEPTITASSTHTITPTDTRVPTITPSVTRSITPSVTPSPTGTIAPSNIPTDTPTDTLTLTPEIGLWLGSRGCGTEYEPGEYAEVIYQANVDGTVLLTFFPPGESVPLHLFGIGGTKVSADEQIGEPWDIPDQAGTWVIEAELLDSSAPVARCDFYVSETILVDTTPPEVTIPIIRHHFPCDSETAPVTAFIHAEDESGVNSVDLYYRRYSTEFDNQQAPAIDVSDNLQDWTFLLELPWGGSSEFFTIAMDNLGNSTGEEWPDRPWEVYPYRVGESSNCFSFLVLPDYEIPASYFSIESAYNAGDCLELCRDIYACFAYTFNSYDGSCRLMSEFVDPVLSSEDYVSGYKSYPMALIAEP